MTIDQKELLRVMEFIEASGDSGASFDDTVESLNARYPTSPQSSDTIMNKIGMSISKRDHYLSLLREKNLVSGSFSKNGVLGLKLTLAGYEYLETLKGRTFGNRVGRFFTYQIGLIYTAVILVVVGGVLTAIVSKWFGL